MNKITKEKGALTVKVNQKKKLKNKDILHDLKINNPKASCSYSNLEAIDQNCEEDSNLDNLD